jgi:hypothetical protein
MNCINDSDPLVKDLLFVSPYDARTTKALISIWQDEHGFNDFPTIADLMDIVYGDVLVEPQGYTGFLEDNFIANNFGYVSNKAILKAALDNCVKYNGSPYKFHLQMLRCLKSADSRKEN